MGRVRTAATAVGLGLAAVIAVSSCAVPLGDLGGAFSEAWDINDGGVVVGVSGLPGNPPETPIMHAFRRTPDGAIEDLGTLDGHDSSGALRINGDGVTVGSSWHSGEDGQVGVLPNRAVRWSATGDITDLGTLGGPTSNPTAVNDAGIIVGIADDAAGVGRAFVHDPAIGHMVALPELPGATGSLAAAVNESGVVVGSTWTAGGRVAVRWDLVAGTVTDLSSTGLRSASGINEAGTIIGTVETGVPGATSPEAGILHAGTDVAIPLGAGPWSQAYDIADDATVIGSQAAPVVGRRAFRWTAATGVVGLTTDQSSAGNGINNHGAMVGKADERSAAFFAPARGAVIRGVRGFRPRLGRAGAPPASHRR